jgi:hypothetical protein
VHNASQLASQDNGHGLWKLRMLVDGIGQRIFPALPLQGHQAMLGSSVATVPVVAPRKPTAFRCPTARSASKTDVGLAAALSAVGHTTRHPCTHLCMYQNRADDRLRTLSRPVPAIRPSRQPTGAGWTALGQFT